MEISQQRKMQMAVLGISLMAPGTIHRNAEELGAVFAELGEDFIVKRELIATDRAPIGRVEGKDYRLTREVAERQVLIRRDPEGEVRGGGSGGQDNETFFSSLERLRGGSSIAVPAQSRTRPSSVALTGVNFAKPLLTPLLFARLAIRQLADARYSTGRRGTCRPRGVLMDVRLEAKRFLT
jgi:hypothetical protein